MPETGSQILSYTGNASLGLGANADIPAIDPKQNLNAIIDAGRTAMLLNHDNNIKLYEQKIKDRNSLYELLDGGKVGHENLNALAEDRPFLKSKKEEASKLFYDMIANGGLNNPQGVTKYRDAIKEYNDATTQANARYIGIKQLEKDKSGEVLKSDQTAYQKHIDNQLSKDFWGMVDPYQKSLDFDHEKMNGFILKNGIITEGEVTTPTPQKQTSEWQSETIKTDKNGNEIKTTKTTTGIVPLKTPMVKGVKGQQLSGTTVSPNGQLSEISFTPEKHVDYGNILANATDAYLHDEEQMTYQNMWRDYFESGDPFSAKKVIDHTNDKINQYNQQRGLTQNDKGYAAPFVIGQDILIDPQTGKVKIGVPPSEFAAKTALASIDGNYVEVPTPVFNKDIAAYKIQKEKANSDAFYKHAMANAANTKAGAYAANLRQQMKLRQTVADQDNFLSEIYTRNILQQPSLIKGEGGTQISLANIKAENSLPVFTLNGMKPVLLQPIGATIVYDGNGKDSHWEGGHYEPQYLLNGNPLDVTKINSMYKDFKKTAGDKWKGGFDDYMKEALKNNFFQYRLKGANGSTDRELSTAAQRIISNAATKKGQTAVFDSSVEQPPLDEQVPNDNQ